jgi:hypothetical protein
MKEYFFKTTFIEPLTEIGKMVYDLHLQLTKRFTYMHLIQFFLFRTRTTLGS